MRHVVSLDCVVPSFIPSTYQTVLTRLYPSVHCTLGRQSLHFPYLAFSCDVRRFVLARELRPQRDALLSFLGSRCPLRSRSVICARSVGRLYGCSLVLPASNVSVLYPTAPPVRVTSFHRVTAACLELRFHAHLRSSGNIRLE